MLITGSRKEYLLSLEDLSNICHTGKHLSNIIKEVINKVRAKKFVAIVSDNGSNVAAAHEVKYIVRCANILTKYFKNSTLKSSWLNEAIKRFSDDVHIISYILKLIKEAILMLERTYTTLADCYLYLLRIATFFKQMPMNDYRLLKNSCIKTFNERYKEFDEDIYLLAFFLHLQYKEAGIHNTQFERIQKTALKRKLLV
ncbi:unnamed protein product [Rhizophagus irregularis]|nr:unnamed protein product [Rhizophagus irregularis]